MEYNGQGNKQQKNIYGIAMPNKIEFYDPDFDVEGGDPLFGKGGGMGNMNFRMGGTSGFGPINLGGGLMDPAQALHEFNMERNKYTPDSPYYKEQAIFSGEKPAQDVYKAAVAAGTNWDKPTGYTLAEAKKYTANAKAHTDTQGTIWKGSLGGGSSTAAAQRAASIARQNKSAIASRPKTQSAQYSNFGRFR